MSNKYDTPWKFEKDIIIGSSGFGVYLDRKKMRYLVDCVNACQGMEDPVNEVDQLKALKAYHGNIRTVGLSQIEVGGFSINKKSWHEAGELPPVGTECEFVPQPNFKDAGFRSQLDMEKPTKVKVLFHYLASPGGSMVAVFSFVPSLGSGATFVDQATAPCFRPIETEKQKTIKEMLWCFDGFFNGDGDNAGQVCEKIYNQFIAGKNNK